jgi:anti-sigma factor RsiW
MNDHPTLDALADAAEDLLSPEQSAAVEAHLATCAECQAGAASLRAVSAELGAAPTPTMPTEVAQRLSRVLVAESADRDRPRTAKVTLGNFGANRPAKPTRRRLVPALAAAAAAAIVGFGAYVVSATAGLNEPPVVTAVNSTQLGKQASALQQAADMDPHRFSRAWQCARQVTDGRIVGLANSRVDGQPALLVYLRSGQSTQVVVVTGCASAAPSAGPSALLSR